MIFKVLETKFKMLKAILEVLESISNMLKSIFKVLKLEITKFSRFHSFHRLYQLSICFGLSQEIWSRLWTLESHLFTSERKVELCGALQVMH